jgi:hypothetical protein
MEQEQIREYGCLQDEIIVKLRSHGFVDGLGASHVFQYLILPSFTPPISWDVFRRPRKGYENAVVPVASEQDVDGVVEAPPRRGHEDDFVLVRSAWRSDLDLEKLRSPVERLRHPYPLVPSIEVHQLSAPSDELAQLAAKLAAIRLPIGASPSVYGIDGVTYEVAIEQPLYGIPLSAKCRLSWWHEIPAAWGELQAWVEGARAVFESAWAGRGAPAPIPLRIKAIDDAAARVEAQQLFYAGQYGRVAELLAEVGTREKLKPAEVKMLEMALKRAGGMGGG